MKQEKKTNIQGNQKSVLQGDHSGHIKRIQFGVDSDLQEATEPDAFKRGQGSLENQDVVKTPTRLEFRTPLIFHDI